MVIFDKNQEILFQAEKLQEDVDSLLLEIDKLEASAKVDAKIVDLNNRVIDLTEENVTDWQSKYNKLAKEKKLGGYLNFKSAFVYSNKNKDFTILPTTIDIGIIFRRKMNWSVGAFGGVGTQESYLIGLSGGMVF